MRVWGAGILNGMRITMRNMLRGPITVQYPREKIDLPERARWAVEMVYDEDGEHKCIACLACEKACPDHVIKIDVTTGEDRSKHIDRWDYQLGACMMCGLCVEACTVDAIHMAHDYELARFDPVELDYPLLEDVPAAKPKRKETPEGAAQAKLSRESACDVSPSEAAAAPDVPPSVANGEACTTDE